MVVAVSVVVIGQDFRGALGGLIESLDQQSLPTSEFEAVLVDLGSTDGTLERLRLMATHRPNLTVVDSAGAVAWEDACTGTYVLRVEPDQRLFPESLARLSGYAAEHGLDALAARVVQPGASVGAAFVADRVELDPAHREAALRGPATLVRRSFFGGSDRSVAELLDGSARVGVLGSYPALLLPHAPIQQLAPADLLQVAAPTISWSGDQLALAVTGTVTAAGEATQVVPVLRHARTGVAYLLPGAVTVEPADGPAPFSLSLTVDVHAAALGEPLAHGLWELELHPVQGESRLGPVSLRWAACPPAVIGRTIVVPAPTAAPTWQLDVGATTWPVIASPDPSQASVTESAAGATMVLQLPGVHVSGAEVLPGEVVLDRLPLAADLITDGQSARVEGFVSGLAGSPKIATRFGDGPTTPSGLCLTISGAGVMQVAKVAPPAPKPPAPPAAAPAKKAPPAPAKATTPPAEKAPAKAVNPSAAAGKKAPAAQGPAKKSPAKKSAAKKKKAPAAKPLTRVQHLRRAVPRSWEPLADRVVKNPLARELYRRINKF